MSASRGFHLPDGTPSTVLVGARNDCLFRIACSLRAQGFSDGVLVDALQRENELRCVPPLSGREVFAIARSVERYEPRSSGSVVRPLEGRPARRTLPAQPIQPPLHHWQGRARAFLAYSQGQLAAEQTALAYLRGRGLSQETIRTAGLGYNPKDVRDHAERWGMSGKPVWLPQGWVIPNVSGGVIWGISIRRPAGRDPKYVTPRGSRRKLYGLDRVGRHSDLIIVEGEFDALLLWQEAGGIASVIGLGGAQNIGQLSTTPVLVGFRRWWNATDWDAAGDSADVRVRALTARARRLALPAVGCKDPTDLWRASVDLAGWVASQVGPEASQDWLRWAEGLLDTLDDGTLCSDSDLGGRRWRQWSSLYDRYTEVSRRSKQSGEAYS